jgi:repressor LexA
MLDGQNIFNIPIYENASAGFGAMAIDLVVDYLPLYFSSAQEAQETICIIVRGDSMYPKIEDGDIIQVHKQSTVDSGQVGVVLIDGEEAFVKKIVYGETWIELHSFNPMYKTMRFNGSDALRIQILGVVKKVIKEM